jgi:hypothetical protein
MSLWQEPQSSESMKKLEGMVWPTLVFEDEGQKGTWGRRLPLP